MAFAPEGQSGFELVKKTTITATFLTSDNLQQCYTIEGNRFIKYNRDGDKVKEFSGNKLGKPSFADVSNPLNILLLYPQYATILVLDNTLSVLNTIDFRKSDVSLLKAACLSPENLIWIFDSRQMKLRQFDNNQQITRESDDLSLVIGHPIAPNFMLCTDKNLFVNDPATGIYVFDKYGSYQKVFYKKGLKSFQHIQEQLLYLRKQRLHAFSLKSFDEQSFAIPDSTNIKQARMESDRLYLLYKTELSIWKF